MSKQSPAFHLFDHVRTNMTKKLSRISSEHTVGAAVRLAIRSGLTFDVDDVAKMAAHKVDGWGVFWFDCGESDYAIASGSERGFDNVSFCRSFEAHRERKPFMVRDVADGWRRGTPTLHKTGSRMYIHRRFHWLVDGALAMLECTSFADDGLSFIGTLTKQVKDGKRSDTKVVRRIRIDHDAIKAFHVGLAESSAPRPVE
jgi:hypothetical protein